MRLMDELLEAMKQERRIMNEWPLAKECENKITIKKRKNTM